MAAKTKAAKDGYIIAKFKAAKGTKSAPTRKRNQRRKPTRGQGKP